MAIENSFDTSFIAELSLREKQIQQNYRPYIQVHKWFARRPGALFRGLILSEFVNGPLAENYFRSHQLSGVRVGDPFMGGGTPLIEANRLGCDVLGYDINPMAWWIVNREIEHLDINRYRATAKGLVRSLTDKIGDHYRTDCVKCGSPDARVKYFLWVKTRPCKTCGTHIDLFPGYLLSRDSRHPRNVVVCSDCGELNEIADRRYLGACSACQSELLIEGPARRGSVNCRDCGTENVFPNGTEMPLAHRMFAMEFYCQSCKRGHTGRFFKRPSESDLRKYEQAVQRWRRIKPRFVPDDEIPPGDESTRLHRWGYQQYRQLFNERQLLGLEVSCHFISEQTDERLRNALATNLSDLLRYNNLLVRYDTAALKALDIFSVHGFPVGLVRCEANLIGIDRGNGRSVGSGGWTNIIAKYASAKQYCDRPFEVLPGKPARKVFTHGEWIGDHLNGGKTSREVDLRCGTATTAEVEPGSLDAVLTDPPYYDAVQYAELMDFCYAWLRRLTTMDTFNSGPATTRNVDELTGNTTENRGLESFTDGLSSTFRRMADALRPGAPLVFTYHHNQLKAYFPIAVALLDSGLTCSTVLPCPAEMGGSIHISGTGSSVVDTVFVCRSQGFTRRDWLVDTSEEMAEIVSQDIAQLRAGGLEPSSGDIRCITHGHITRMIIWHLRDHWNANLHTGDKLNRIEHQAALLAQPDSVRKLVRSVVPNGNGPQAYLFAPDDNGQDAKVPFRKSRSTKFARIWMSTSTRYLKPWNPLF